MSAYAYQEGCSVSSGLEEDRLSSPEQTRLDDLTASLRQENPTEIGGYAVYSFVSCFSADLEGDRRFYDTREAAQTAAREWESRPDYEATVTGVHETETVSHHARISPVTAAAMERVRRGEDLADGPVQLSCRINGQDALCVEYENGLDISISEQHPAGLSSTMHVAHSASVSTEGGATMSDDVEQTTPSSWTERGGMVSQQESANDWLKEIADAAKAHEDAPSEQTMDRGQDMGR